MPSRNRPGRPRRAPTDSQQALGFVVPEAVRAAKPKQASEFVVGDDNQVFGSVPLTDYLEKVGQGWVVRLAKHVRELDYRKMEARYDARGRRALHPRLIVGLVAYGLIRGVRSLRDLELLALMDAGAFLMTGGVQPDHSTIGRALLLHADELSAGFFVEATKAMAARMGAKAGTVAIDATVVESVASHWNSLTAEAASVVAAEAKTAAAEAEAAVVAATAHSSAGGADRVGECVDPTDVRRLERDAKRARAVAESAARCAETAVLRQERRDKRGHKGVARVAASDPEAVIQQRKDGVSRPSFKPAIAVHESGLIVGQHVEPTYETASVQPLVDQHEQVFGAPPTTALLDAGYHNQRVLQLFCDKDVDVLCPAGSNFDPADETGRIGKDQFVYLPQDDVYRCPKGRLLTFRTSYRHGDGTLRRYRSSDCEGCPLKARCVRGPKGRQISRYDGDEFKEAMREVLKHPEARAKFQKRQAIVEPVFARLRLNQTLTRFSRRGRTGAALEFALSCLAYNLQMVARRPALPAPRPNGSAPPRGHHRSRRRPHVVHGIVRPSHPWRRTSRHGAPHGAARARG